RVDAFPTDHQRRTVQGVALGDLDRNGFVDVVSVSNVDMPQALPLLPNPTAWDPQTVRHADVLNPVARFVPSFATTAEGLVWSGVDLLPGSLSVELNGGNSHRWVEVTARGSVGTTPDGTVNRDGIGAVITFTPQRKVAGQGVIDGSTVMTPVMGGSSLGSQHSLAAEFGLGTSRIGRVEIIWPGGVRNRLYGVRASERILLPEIPCSYNADWSSARQYSACVARALEDLVEAEVLTRPQSQRLRRSAIRAFFDR
ncbi:MAG: ASPIC/UnbV domain-containing protein, partial [Acidobacteriota bacterium]